MLIVVYQKGVLDNQKKIHHPNSVFPEAVVDIYCGDTHPSEKKCKLRTNPKDPKGPKVTAFASAWVERGNLWNTYNVVLCPRFFNEKKSLEALLKDIKDGKEDGENPDTYKKAWGFTIYHELTHLDPIIATEEVWDPAYYACPARKLANQNGCSGKSLWTPPGWDEKKRGTAHTLINGDSWGFFASSAYFMKALELKEPGEPKNDCGIYSGESYSNYTWFDPKEMAPDSEPAESKDVTNESSVVPSGPGEDDHQPPEDPPTPTLPYKVSDLPKELATPFDAKEYFKTYGKPSESEPKKEEPSKESKSGNSKSCKDCGT